MHVFESGKNLFIYKSKLCRKYVTYLFSCPKRRDKPTRIFVEINFKFKSVFYMYFARHVFSSNSDYYKQHKNNTLSISAKRIQ